AGGRAGVLGWAAARWRDGGRSRRDAGGRGAALAVTAGAGGHVLAVSGDLVGSARGIRQRLEGERVRPASLVGALAGLPRPAQPGPGRSRGLRPDRRLPALAVNRRTGRDVLAVADDVAGTTGRRCQGLERRRVRRRTVVG